MAHLYVFGNEIWPWHIGLRWAIVALWDTCFYSILLILAGNEDMHKISGEFEFRQDRTTDYCVSCPWGQKNSHRLIMGKWCLHASSFIFDRIIIKVAGSRTGIKARTSSISGLWIPKPIYIFFWNEIWSWHIGHWWAIVALWATYYIIYHRLTFTLYIVVIGKRRHIGWSSC